MGEPKRPYRVGIVGAGSISKLHLAGIVRHPDRMRAVALCDPAEDVARARAGVYGVPDVYTNLDEMVSEAKLDVAVVCTPTHVRKSVVVPLIEAGVAVFCEKPFGETFAEAAAIAKRSAETSVPVAVNQNFRRFFSFAVARDVLARGELGRPLHLTQTVLGLRRDTGWRLERERYVMAVISIHWFDGYRFLLGDEAESVYCRAVNSPATDGGADTAVSVVIQFRGGAVASLSESFSSYAKQATCSLDCERGALVMNYEAVTEMRPGGEAIEHGNPFDKAEATYWLLDDLMRAVEEGREPETSAGDNVGSMRILEAAYRSAAEGRAVRLGEIG